MSLIACIAGARPNFMKVKPVVDALENRGHTVHLIHSGQHYDAQMSDVFFTDLGLRKPDHHLNVGSGSHANQTAKVMIAFEELAERYKYEALVVVGDVNSTVACAMVGAKLGMLVAHVEAGLRSRDWAMPEEVNRVITDRISDLLLAPSQDAVENLEDEGCNPRRIDLVGNVMVDTLLSNIDRARPLQTAKQYLPGDYGLVTLHRPSNVDDPDSLKGILGALVEVAEDCPLLFPVHPRTRAVLKEEWLSPHITLLEPQGYLDFISLQADARIILTDSGGIQEESTILGIPCLTLRDNTERPITVTSGTNQVVGTDPERIVEVARNVLTVGVEQRKPELWDGRAGERIAEVMSRALLEDDRARPTDIYG